VKYTANSKFHFVVFSVKQIATKRRSEQCQCV